MYLIKCGNFLNVNHNKFSNSENSKFGLYTILTTTINLDKNNFW